MPTLSPAKPKILAFCDSPALREGQAPTGFARVARNLFTRWGAHAQIDIWGIGFNGEGYRDVPWTVYPSGGMKWSSPENLTQFLSKLSSGGYTHCFLLNDPDAFCVGNFPKLFKELCEKNKIRSLLYYPVDASLEPEWLEIIRSVDVAVTFTEYGMRETFRVALENAQPSIRVYALPHGLELDFSVFAEKQRKEIRANIKFEGKPFIGDGDFVILNVNKNEWRKDPLRTLEIVAALVHEEKVPAKLVMRMGMVSGMNGTHLLRAATALGLEQGKHWVQMMPVAEKDMPALYNAADLYLTTTLGEGWGLGITEALGCGTPVAIPEHTSCKEIASKLFDIFPDDRGFNLPWNLLPLEPGYVMGYDTRMRQRVDLKVAAKVVAATYRDPRWGAKGQRVALPFKAREWLSWDRIALEMYAFLTGAKPAQVVKGATHHGSLGSRPEVDPGYIGDREAL